MPVAVIVMMAGEIGALHVILVGEPTELEERLAALAILAGVFGVATPILNTIIKTTTTNLEAYGDSYVNFARRTGAWTIRVIHLALLLLAFVVLAGKAD